MRRITTRLRHFVTSTVVLVVFIASACGSDSEPIAREEPFSSADSALTTACAAATAWYGLQPSGVVPETADPKGGRQWAEFVAAASQIQDKDGRSASQGLIDAVGHLNTLTASGASDAEVFEALGQREAAMGDVQIVCQ